MAAAIGIADVAMCARQSVEGRPEFGDGRLVETEQQRNIEACRESSGGARENQGARARAGRFVNCFSQRDNQFRRKRIYWWTIHLQLSNRVRGR